MQRRTFLLTASTASSLVVADAAWALNSEWWPYEPGQSVRIAPRSTLLPEKAAAPVSDLPPADTTPQREARSRFFNGGTKQHSALRTPPTAYDVAARKFNIDPWVMYGVALQESKMKFGDRVLPYPWTLCVAGKAHRYGTYESTLKALRHFVTEKGIKNVDCGAMQVNWRWHNDKLKTFENALDPYPNLYVGAQILREHFERQGSWHRAAALYHTGSDKDAATVSRGRRYANDVFARLARMGVDVASVQKQKGWSQYA